MTEEKTKEQKTENLSPREPSKVGSSKSGASNAGQSFARDKGRDRRGRRGGSRREPRVKSEFDQKIISIRRVVRVVAGGRRFSFSVALVAGNRKGKVGVGVGKSTDTPSAINKAFRDAQKNIITVEITPELSISHEVMGKMCGSKLLMMPAPGRGILAGSSVRDVLELAGIKNINAKILSRSKNKLNNAKAAILALRQLRKTAKND